MAANKSEWTLKPLAVLAAVALVLYAGFHAVTGLKQAREAAKNGAVKNDTQVKVDNFELRRVVITCYEGLTLVNVGVHGFFYKLSPDGKPIPCKD
jgi:hypothetical protein